MKWVLKKKMNKKEQNTILTRILILEAYNKDNKRMEMSEYHETKTECYEEEIEFLNDLLERNEKWK